MSEQPDQPDHPDRPDIEFRADPQRPGGWWVLSDGVRQSYLDPADPTHLEFDYIKAIGAVIGALPDGPLSAAHVGGAACQVPRFIEATRPGSRQVVFEPDTELTRLVLERLPLPTGSEVRIEELDGRTGVTGLPDDAIDLMIVDAYAAGRVPADLTTAEFLVEVDRVLRPAGVLVLNVADDRESSYRLRLQAALATVFPHRIMLGRPTVMLGMRFGNIVMAASRAELPTQQINDALRAQDECQGVLSGDRLDDEVADAAPLSDADPMRSPAPPDEVYRPVG